MQASCINPRRLHWLISCRKSGSRMSAPNLSIRFCFRYWPARPHVLQFRWTALSRASTDDRSIEKAAKEFLNRALGMEATELVPR